MKTIRFTAFSILFGLLVLVSACKKETTPAAAPQTGSKIMVTGQDAGAGLKSTIIGQTTVWVAGDKVGIYSADARTTSGGVTPIVNVPFTAAASAASSAFSGTMYWSALNTSHTFYAYYPYTVGTAASNAVPVSLASAQTQSAANNSDHIGALDFLVATPTTITSPSNTDAVGSAVNLNYNHLFTVLEFQIKGTPGTQLKAVKLVGTSNPVAFSGGTIDITQTPPATGAAYAIAGQTGTTTQAVVTLTTPATLTATNTDTKVYMVINPGTQTDNCLIGLSSDGTTWTYISKAAPTGGFLRGMKYVVAIDQSTAGAAPIGSPIDADGNAFRIVTIGTQTWMAENLKTTKYNDGTAIPNVTDNSQWGGLGTGAYCWYNNEAATYQSTYGALYNWYTVDNNESTKIASNGGKNICPIGWHVPTDTEWTTLTTYLGGESVAGGKLKETGTTHWTTPNTGATNETGFTALPGGYRNWDGWSFRSIGDYGYWWSSSPNGTYGDCRHMIYINSDGASDTGIRTFGLSVRCVKD
jgi:uncharacterized protein (TIGR02145 family)